MSQKFMKDLLTAESAIRAEKPYYPQNCVVNIFELQRGFAKRFIPFEHCQKDERVRRDWTLELIVCILDELSEALGWLPFKHWKNYDTGFELDVVEVRFELIDVLHFLVNLAIVHGIDPTRSHGNNGITDLVAPIAPAKPEYLNNQLEYKRLMVCMITNLSDINIEPTKARSSIFSAFRVLRRMFGMFGMTEEDVYVYYTAKNQENYDRQKRGY